MDSRGQQQLRPQKMGWRESWQAAHCWQEAVRYVDKGEKAKEAEEEEEEKEVKAMRCC